MTGIDNAGAAGLGPDEVPTPTAAVIDCSRRLAGDVAAMAAAIAVTEDQVAQVHEQIAERVADEDPTRADTLLAHARDAREFADHERAEHHRWKHVAKD